MMPMRRVVAEKRRLIYPLAAAIVLNVALAVAVVYPLSAKAARGDADAEAAAKQLAAARLDYDSARATVSGKAAADTELQKFYGAVLPKTLSAARRISTLKIEQLVKASGVILEERSTVDTVTKESALAKLTLTLVLTGEYEAIRRFIYQLETATEFLVLEHVTLAQTDDEDDLLNVNVRIATYFRTGDDGD